MRQCATITIGDVMKKKIRVCENSMVLVYILAMSGGFMDAYSYMCRGEVFANAQTGNILLMAVNLAKGALISADSVRCEGCEPENLLNDCEMLFYASDDSCLTPVIHLQLPEKKTFDCFMIQEVIELGHRVRGYAIDVWVDDEWQTLVEKQCIGYRWAEHFDPVTTDQVRIRVISAVAVPVLRSFGLYRLPESVFEERQDLKEKKDLAKGESAKVTVAQKEVIVDFGGIFPFNTVVFNGAGIWSYEVHAFDGTQYFKVFEGQRPDKRQICKFETVRASYKLKLCVNIEIENDLEIEIYDV